MEEWEDGDSSIGTLVREFADKPFRLEIEDPLRALLLEITKNEWVMCVVGHHLVIDHKGMGIVVDSIMRDYSRRSRGVEHESSQPAVPSYFDFIEREQARLENGDLPKRAHHAKRLSATPLLSIASGNRDRIRLNATARHMLTIDGQRYEQLGRIARECYVTQFTLLLQALFSALSVVYHQTDLVVQVIHDIRRRPFLRTVGHFGDMLLIEQTGISEVLESAKLQLLQEDLFRAISDPVPIMLLAEQVTWIRDRLNRGLNPCEVMINYVSETGPPKDVREAGPSWRPFALQPRLTSTLEATPPVVDQPDNGADPFDGILIYLEMVEHPSSIEVTMFSQSEAINDNVATAILQRILLVLTTL